MGYALVVLGIAAISFACWLLRVRGGHVSAGGRVVAGEEKEVLLAGEGKEEISLRGFPDYKDLEARLGSLAADVEKISQCLSRLEYEQAQVRTEQSSFAEVLRETQRAALYEQVRRSYEGGKGIAEIARDLGRGKGEIELILNLQRSAGPK